MNTTPLSSIPPQRDRLIELFVERNEKINLSAIRTPIDIYNKHILDSLELNKVIDISNNAVRTPDGAPSKYNPAQHTLLDLWTGWGFPLLPLAITNPTVKCIGLDSTRKKLSAVQEIAQWLELTNVSTVRSRAEDHKEKYDMITARAVGYADKLFLRALPLLKKGGYLCLYKLLTKQEDDVILGQVRLYNLTLSALHQYTLPGDETQRVIYVMQK